MKNLVLFILLFIPIMTKSQEMKKIDPIDITDKISVEEFQKIKVFILEQKHTQLHGSLYGECPFYQNNDISVFLLPRFANLKLNQENPITSPDEYNKLSINHNLKDNNNDYVSSLYILEESDRILLTPYWDTEESILVKDSLLDIILPQIIPSQIAK